MDLNLELEAQTPKGISNIDPQTTRIRSDSTVRTCFAIQRGLYQSADWSQLTFFNNVKTNWGALSTFGSLTRSIIFVMARPKPPPLPIPLPARNG